MFSIWLHVFFSLFFFSWNVLELVHGVKQLFSNRIGIHTTVYQLPVCGWMMWGEIVKGNFCIWARVFQNTDRHTPQGTCVWKMICTSLANLLLAVTRASVYAGKLYVSGLILGLHPANERRCYCNDVSHWLGANPESVLCTMLFIYVKFCHECNILNCCWVTLTFNTWKRLVLTNVQISSSIVFQCTSICSR